MIGMKDVAYVKIKEHQLKRSRFDHGTGALFQDSKIIEASYKISLFIAEQKPHSIGETLVKPCMVEPDRLVLDHSCDSPFFAIQLNETTDVA